MNCFVVILGSMQINHKYHSCLGTLIHVYAFMCTILWNFKKNTIISVINARKTRYFMISPCFKKSLIVAVHLGFMQKPVIFLQQNKPLVWKTTLDRNGLKLYGKLSGQFRRAGLLTQFVSDPFYSNLDLKVTGSLLTSLNTCTQSNAQRVLVTFRSWTEHLKQLSYSSQINEKAKWSYSRISRLGLYAVWPNQQRICQVSPAIFEQKGAKFIVISIVTKCLVLFTFYSLKGIIWRGYSVPPENQWLSDVSRWCRNEILAWNGLK